MGAFFIILGGVLVICLCMALSCVEIKWDKDLINLVFDWVFKLTVVIAATVVICKLLCQ
jgi:hypothetical protein